METQNDQSKLIVKSLISFELGFPEENMQTVEKNVKKKNLNVWYEAMDPDKGKKVYCYISPRVCTYVRKGFSITNTQC